MSSSPTTPNVQTSSTRVPQPTEPVAGRAVTTASPQFRWTTIPGANQFELQLGSGEDFEKIYYETVVDGPTTIRLPDLLPDGVDRVCWRVRVTDGEDVSWSTPATFFVSEEEADTEGDFLLDAPPVPIRPLDGESVAAQAVTFTWEQVPEASGYRVQIASTDAFQDPVAELTLDRTTHLTLYEAVPEGHEELYWRVRPLFSGGTEGQWSRTAHFQPESAPQDAVESTPDVDGNGSSSKESPRAAGPARTSRTSRVMAWTFISVLLISFALTILLIGWAS